MKIAVAGASGRAGSEITKELSRRGHAVTAIARNPEKIAALANVTSTKGDVLDQAGLAKLWAGHDVAMSSVHFLASDPLKLIGAAKASEALVATSSSAVPAAWKSLPASNWLQPPVFPSHTRPKRRRAGLSSTCCGRKRT